MIDQATAHKKDLQVGQTIGVQANGPTLRMTISGFVHFGGAASLGGATLSGFDLPTAQRLFQRVGKLDQIRAKAKPGVTPAQLAAEIRAHPAAGHAGEDRTGAGEVGREGHRELPQLPAGLPARVRRDRALRRRVRDRELALDHDHAADARACDPADARRVATPGAVLDRRRGLRDRHPRLGRRDRRRPRARRRPLQAVRRRRLHAAEQRSRPAHADGDRRARRRDPRHRPGEPPPRLPRDARAADRGRARGRRAAAGAVREVPAGRLGAADGGRVRACSSTACSATASERSRSSSSWASGRC